MKKSTVGLTINEKKALKLLAEKPTKEVEKITGVPFGRLRSLQVIYKINKKNFYWTEAEYKIIRKFYGKKTGVEISKMLGRSIYQVYEKAKFLGLK